MAGVPSLTASSGAPNVRGNWGNDIEREIRRRITLSVAAFAYEIRDDAFMSDHEFDRLAESINPRQGTCHPLLDEFFAHEFSPMTGLWIHRHPELVGIERIFDRWFVGDIAKSYRRSRLKGKLP